jgi:hypothetical protein
MTPVGFSAAGQFQLLGEIRAGRPQHRVLNRLEDEI